MAAIAVLRLPDDVMVIMVIQWAKIGEEAGYRKVQKMGIIGKWISKTKIIYS